MHVYASFIMPVVKHATKYNMNILFNRRLLLDTGEEGKSEYITNLKRVLQEEEATLEHIIITHWHHDHIGGVKDVLKHVGSGISSKVLKYESWIERLYCLCYP